MNTMPVLLPACNWQILHKVSEAHLGLGPLRYFDENRINKDDPGAIAFGISLQDNPENLSLAHLDMIHVGFILEGSDSEIQDIRDLNIGKMIVKRTPDATIAIIVLSVKDAILAAVGFNPRKAQRQFATAIVTVFSTTEFRRIFATLGKELQADGTIKYKLNTRL